MKKYAALLKKILVLCLVFCVITGCSAPSVDVPEDTEIEDSDDEDKDDDDGGKDKTVDDDRCQGTLHVAADACGDGGREETQHGH